MTPTWAPVVGWEGLYEVSDDGRVRRLARTCANSRGGGTHVRPMRLLKGAKSNGYMCVALQHLDRSRKYFVHVLVLSAFVGPRPAGHDTRHLNGDRADNRIHNLQWGTSAENAADRIAHGTWVRGESQGGHKLTAAVVREIRRRVANGELHRVVAQSYGVGRQTIGKVVSGHSWRHLEGAL